MASADDPLYHAYLAGLLDGEGYIGMFYQAPRPKKAPNGCWYVRVEIGLTDVFPLEELQAAYGGGMRQQTYPTKPHWKPYWKWQVRGKYARRFLTDLLPYLRIKDDEAAVALQFWDGPDLGRGPKSGCPPTEMERRAGLAAELKRLRKEANYAPE